MNRTVKKKWVQALKSGKYKQGRGHLKQVDQNKNEYYCCLGVLCDLYCKEKKKGFDAVVYNSAWFDSDAGGDVLPPSVQKWAGLDHPNPITKEYGALSTVNDSMIKLSDFKQIASMIEESL